MLNQKVRFNRMNQKWYRLIKGKISTSSTMQKKTFEQKRLEDIPFVKYCLQKLCILSGLFCTLVLLWPTVAGTAPSADLWPHWQTYQQNSTRIIDHAPWDMLLGKYLMTNHPSGINRFNYAGVTQSDRRILDHYLASLQEEKVSRLNRLEQKAYWINLYNALTVRVILDHYPVDTIRDIDISPGLFSNGPWDAKLLNIEGEKISLNDIEHRILRPIFKDNRLHYALNCASLGCPNLQPVAFTAGNTEDLLEKGAREYINSTRGARIIEGKLTASSIYKWFREDFGDTEEGVLRHLQKYADRQLAEKLRNYTGSIRYDYDWSLNQPD